MKNVQDYEASQLIRISVPSDPTDNFYMSATLVNARLEGSENAAIIDQHEANEEVEKLDVREERIGQESLSETKENNLNILEYVGHSEGSQVNQLERRTILDSDEYKTEQQGLPLSQQQDQYSLNWNYKKVFIEFNKQAIPFSLSRMVDVVGEIAAGYLFSRAGSPEYLAANNLIIVSNRFFVVPAAALFFSISPRLSKCKDDYEKVGTVIRQGFLCAGLLSIVAVAGLLSSGPLFKSFGLNHRVCDIVEDFYIGALLNIPVTFMSSVIQQLTLVTGRQRVSLLINIVNNGFSIGCGSVLMFGSLGFPKLGVRGLGYGYSIGAALSGVSYFAYLNWVKECKKYKFLRSGAQDLRKFWLLLVEALPFSCQTIFDFLQLYIGALLAGRLSIDALSASRIVEMLYIIPYLAIIRYPQITCIMGGRASSIGNHALLNKIFNVTILSMLLLTSIWTVPVYLFSEKLINLFVDVNNLENRQIVALAKDLFWLYPTSLLPEILRYTVAGALRGFNDYRISMYNSLIWLAGIGSGAIYLGYQFGGTLNWIYGARTIALAAGAASLTYQYQKKKKDSFQENSVLTVVEDAGYQVLSGQPNEGAEDKRITASVIGTDSLEYLVRHDLPRHHRDSVSAALLTSHSSLFSTKLSEKQEVENSSANNNGLQVIRQNKFSRFNCNIL